MKTEYLLGNLTVFQSPSLEFFMKEIRTFVINVSLLRKIKLFILSIVGFKTISF